MLRASLLKGRTRILVPRHVRWRLWQHGVRTKQTRQIRGHIRCILVRHTRQGKMHGCPHEFDPVSPAICVACHGSHTALKPMASRTIPEDQVFPFGLRPKLLCLITGRCHSSGRRPSATQNRTMPSGRLSDSLPSGDRCGSPRLGSADDTRPPVAFRSGTAHGCRKEQLQ